jgi:serine/threonine protein phosphatase PrpC
MGITVLQLQKRASYEYKYIQDKYAIDATSKTFALADGTTQSFNSGYWADLLTKRFIEHPLFSVNELVSLFTSLVPEFKNAKYEFSSNLAKASLERTKQNKGGTTTFMGLRFKDQNKVEVISCGDSNLFLLTSNNKINAFPYTDIDALDSDGNFINTEQLVRGEVDETYFKQNIIEVNSSDILILATDALSRLLLKKPSTIKELVSIKKFQDFHQFCLTYWEYKELQEDDITAIVIPVNNMVDVINIHPPDYFSFPKEHTEEFVPKIDSPKKITKYTDMEINEIKNQFNGVMKDFQEVKRKLKFQEMLLMVTISLLVVNIAISFYSTVISNKTLEVNKDANIKMDPQSSNGKTKESTNSKPENADPAETNQKITYEEAQERQLKLIKAGYNVSSDGIWGEQSEKAWNDYQQKKKSRND